MDYFQEFGWRELRNGEQPNHLLHMARFLIDFGIHDDNMPEDWPSLPPPASKDIVKNLPVITIKSRGKDCPICLKKFQIREKAKQMPCEHLYHLKCLTTWLQKTNSCPSCRYELPTDDAGYEAYKKEKKRTEKRREHLENLHNSMFS